MKFGKKYVVILIIWYLVLVMYYLKTTGVLDFKNN